MTWPSDPAIPGYSMVRPLGINGAEVYLAHDLATGSRVALRVWSGERNSECHEREKVAARLRHPNIVEVREVGRTLEGCPFSVWEWLPEPTVTLRVRLIAKELSAREVVEVLGAVVSAVQYARSQGMQLLRIQLSDVVFSQGAVPKLMPVFLDATSADNIAADLRRLAVFLDAVAHAQSNAEPWGRLRTIAAECSLAPGPRMTSLDDLVRMLSDLRTATPPEGRVGPTAHERDTGLVGNLSRGVQELEKQGGTMFEPLPEKPPHMAGKWIMLIGALGGGVGVAIAAFLLGEEAMQSNMVLFGCGGAGILVGVVAGWKLMMPSTASSAKE